MKKVLVMVDWFEPGFKAGGPIRSCVNLVKQLSSRADISVVTRNTDYHESKGYKEIDPDKWVTYKGSRVFYFSSDTLSFFSIRSLLLKESPDVLYLNSMFSLYFTIIPFIISRLWLRNTKVVIAPRGMLAEGALTIKSTKKKIFLRLFRSLGAQSIEWHATNAEEANDIRKIFPGAAISVAPNLVLSAGAKLYHIEKVPGKLKLISIARISPEKNLLYALQVLEKVHSPVELDIYGTVNDERYFMQCKSQIELMPWHQIAFKGSIKPEEIPSALASSHFLFMPTLGENFGHIIIESFSAGTPVLISDRTPWRSLEKSQVGFDIELSAFEKFVSIVNDMVHMDDVSYTSMSHASFTFAKKYIEEKNDLNSYKFLYT